MKFDLPRNLVFDLDGTLLDSLPGIRYSAEAAFRACGLQLGDVDLRSLIGPPIRTILSRMAERSACGRPSEEDLDRLVDAFRWSYDSEGWKMTPHFEGAADLLQSLRAAGQRLFVVSNKPRHISLRILQTEGTLPLFDEIITRDSHSPPYSNKSQMMRYLVQKWEIEPADCLMVGDTMEDAEAASNTGMQFCLMTHGYGSVPLESGVPVAFRASHFSQLMPNQA